MIANIIASISLFLSILLAIFYLRDREHAKYQLENDYINRLMEWHEKTVNILVKLNIPKREKNSFQYQEDLATLSSLIEQGRFYFPNIDQDNGYGYEKPSAYRGYRNLVLDFLVASYNLFNEPNHCIDKANKLQRHYTSFVFEIVNPKNRLNKIKKLTDRFFIQEKSFEDFLDNIDSSSLTYIWDKPTRSKKISTLQEKR